MSTELDYNTLHVESLESYNANQQSLRSHSFSRSKLDSPVVAIYLEPVPDTNIQQTDFHDTCTQLRPTNNLDFSLYYSKYCTLFLIK